VDEALGREHGSADERGHIDHASLTSLMDGLERLALAERSPHPTDRRTILATITEKGRKVAADATDALNEIRFGTAPLNRKELDALTEVLKVLRAGADDFEP
jgi:DNA-binding MarR family transcriptional regulator